MQRRKPMDSTGNAAMTSPAESKPTRKTRRRCDAQERIMPPVLSMRVLVTLTGLFLVLIVVFLVVGQILSMKDGTTNDVNKPIYMNPQEIPETVLRQIDAVLILGGGKPTTYDHPPIYVEQRCDDAAAVVVRYRNSSTWRRSKPASNRYVVPDLPILCLSAGTAHLPQLMDAQHGLPIWESTSTAAYLAKRHNLTQNVFVETTSYDTIGNAYFARTAHTDIVGWNRLLIITNEFHMARTKAIFDWIFGIDAISSRYKYKLFYLQSPNVGLSDDALQVRKDKEAKSEAAVNKFAKQYRRLNQVWSFLNTRHDLYTANKLVERASGANPVASEITSDLVKKSYGGT